MGWNPFGISTTSDNSGGTTETVRYVIEQNTINGKKVFRLKQTINGTSTYVGVNISFNADEISYTSDYATTVTQALDYLYKNKDNIGKVITDIKFTSSSIGNLPNQPGATDTYTITYNDNTTSTFKIYNGVNGINGKSAYEIWIDNGNTGSIQDFLNSLVGEKGTSISQANVDLNGHLIIILDDNTQIDAGNVKGADGTSVNIKGQLTNESDLPTSANDGDGYIISGELWVYTSGKWINAGTIQGPQGNDGVGITKTEINNGELIITYSNGTIVNLGKVVGDNGSDGKEIELQVNNDILQWRYVGTTDWISLFSLSTLQGKNGREIELQATKTMIQWKYIDSEEWTDLIALSEIKGDKGDEGIGITNISFTSSTKGDVAGIAGATDTYTITLSNNTSYTFKIYNGLDGSATDITIDTEMSDNSENAVQNRVIKTYVDNIVGNIQTILATLTTVQEEG